MARLLSIVRTLVILLRRDWQTFNSFMGNNLFHVGFALLFMGVGTVLLFSMTLVCTVLFFPLSASVLRKIPSERWRLWPLSRTDAVMLRIASLGLNPLFWLLFVLAWWKNFSMGLILMVGGMFAFGFLIPVNSSSNFGGWRRRVPDFPGPLNQLIRKNLRELLSTLDFYCAVAFAGAAAFFRMKGMLPDEALIPLTMIVLLILSTYAQNLFGLDGQDGMARYRLLPVAGWKILFAKDVVFLFTVFLLTLPLAVSVAMAACLVALAVGHRASVRNRMEQQRWRFQAGGSFAGGIFQVILMAFSGFGAGHYGSVFLLPCIGIYLLSIWWFGKETGNLAN